MRLGLLQQLLAVPSPSRREEGMVAFIAEHVRRRGVERCGQLVTDKFNNVYIRKGKPGIVPCVAAHLDTVHEPGMVKIVKKQGRLFGVNEQGKPTGIGGDDKAGVYICLELLERFEDIAVVLFAAEEIGCFGAQNAPAEWFKDVGYLIEFDCPGRGLVSYTSGNERLFANDGEFIKTAAPVMQAHGLTRWQHHPYSDVMALRRRFDFSCLNLSSGYYNWHRPDEFIVVAEVEAAINAGEALITALGNRAYPFKAGTEDNAAPLYTVTGLQGNNPPEPKKMTTNKSAAPAPGQPPPPDTSVPEAVPASLEPLAEPDDDSSLWNRYYPTDMPFFKIGLLDRLLRRPYHTVKLSGPFKLKELVADYRDQTYRSETVIDQSGNQNVFRLLLRLDGDVFGYYEDKTFKIYAPTPEAAQAAAKQFCRYIKPQPPGLPFYYVISIADHGPLTEKVAIERSAPVATEELALHYGADFPAWETQWQERLYRVSSGLTIFHGPPGTGKTTFLRALMYRLLDKAVFYFIPVSAAEILFDLGFINFWVEQTHVHRKKRKFVILEDAEDLLRPRDEGNRDRVSNMLNLADGFIGDHLKLHVIATTNAPVRKLDPAILRPGRLLDSRKFRRLTHAEADRLAAAKGLKLAEQKDFSLAEIYNGAPVTPEFNPERQIGFAQ